MSAGSVRRMPLPAFHPTDGDLSAGTPALPFDIGSIDFPMPSKTHAISCRAAASKFFAASWASNSTGGK